MNINIEGSAVSRSMSETSKSAKTRSYEAASSGIFPLFDYMTQYITLPSIMYGISILFSGLQTIVTALWIPNTNIWTIDNDWSKIIDYFQAIVCFAPKEVTDTDMLYTFAVYTVIFFSVFFFVIFQIIYYSQRRRFIKWTLYPTRLFIELVSLLMLHPMALLCGRSFKLMAQKNALIQNYFVFAFSLLYFIFLTLVFNMSFSLIIKSVYLPVSPYAAFNGRPYITFSVASSSILLLENALSIFPGWVNYFLIIIHVVPGIFLMILFSRRPFLNSNVGIWFLGIIVICISFDVIRIACFFIKNINNMIIIITFLVVVVLSLVYSFVFYYFQRKSLMKLAKSAVEKLNEVEGEKNEEVKFTILDSVNLATSEAKAITFLQFIVSEHIYQFLDFPTIKYLIQIHHTTNTLLICLRVLAFFPCYTSYLNFLYPELSQRRDLAIYEKFFLYQIQRLKIHRTSASSSACATSLRELGQFRHEIESNMGFFWEQQSYMARNLPNLAVKINKLQSLYEESIADFNNSLQHFTDYENFLVECKSDFAAAVKTHYKRNLTESGNIFKIDNCFGNFVKNFPSYLKLNILNLSGRFIVKTEKRKGSSLSNSSNKEVFYSSSSSSSNIDAVVEESIGKQLFPQTRLRIALQHTLENKKSKTSFYHMLITFVSLFVSLFIGLFIYIMFNSSVETRSATKDRINNIYRARFQLFCTTLTLLVDHGTKTGKIGFSLTAIDNPEPYPPYYDNVILLQYSMNRNIEGRLAFENFTKSVAEYAKENQDATEYASAIFTESTRLAACTDNSFKQYIPYDINLAFTYITLTQTILNIKLRDNFMKFFELNEFCELANSSAEIHSAFDLLQKTMYEGSIVDDNAFNQRLKYLYIFLPISFFIVVGVPVIVVFLLHIDELQKVLNFLTALPQKVKKDSQNRLFLLSDDPKIQSSEDKYSVFLFWFILFMMTLFNVANAIIVFYQLYSVTQKSALMSHITFWAGESRLRKCAVTESLLWTYMGILFETRPQFDYIIYSKATYLAYNSITSFIDSTSRLMQDSSTNSNSNNGNGVDDNGAPSAIGYYQPLDDLMLKQFCETSGETLHDRYRCASSQQMLNLYKALLTDAMKGINKLNGRVSSEFLDQSVHYVFNHLLPVLLMIDDMFDSVSKKTISESKTIFDITFPVLLVFTAVNFVFMFILLKLFDNVFQVILVFIRRIHPQAIMSSPDLVKYIFNKSGTDDVGMMTMHQRIMHSSKDAILCLDYKGVIEMANPTVSNTFGFTPDQLLGQSILSLVADASRVQVENQLNLMRHKQSAMTFEDHIDCISDDDSLLRCLINVLAMLDGKGDVDSFVVILRDESILQKQQKEAEDAKKSSENLLYQILPRGIVVRLNQGEKDISFSVPSSTIMFVDIVKFSEYAQTLAPQEIMNNLSVVFGMFDTQIQKYDELIKIKLIGDVYMCAGGLFNLSIAPTVHSEQMIKFGLDCLQMIEEANMRLNSNLSVRIGINTGGPLIAGVLGSDKPTFDIIGDPINIASRLQSTDIAGRIQISQAVYDLVSNMDFVIEPRGEIMLKGKGKTMTFLITSYKQQQQGLSAEASSGAENFMLSSFRNLSDDNGK